MCVAPFQTLLHGTLVPLSNEMYALLFDCTLRDLADTLKEAVSKSTQDDDPVSITLEIECFKFYNHAHTLCHVQD